MKTHFDLDNYRVTNLLSSSSPNEFEKLKRLFLKFLIGTDVMAALRKFVFSLNGWLLIFVFYSTPLFSNTIIVNSENDKRFIAYVDSSECYKFGLWQSENIKKIKCNSDGKKFQKEAMEYQIEIGKKYTTKAIKIGKPVFMFRDSDGEHTWSIGIFKKPINTVLLKVNRIQDTHVKKTVSTKGIWMPSGNIMNKDDFVERYGKEVYNRIVER